MVPAGDIDKLPCRFQRLPCRLRYRFGKEIQPGFPVSLQAHAIEEFVVALLVRLSSRSERGNPLLQPAQPMAEGRDIVTDLPHVIQRHARLLVQLEQEQVREWRLRSLEGEFPLDLVENLDRLGFFPGSVITAWSTR